MSPPLPDAAPPIESLFPGLTRRTITWAILFAGLTLGGSVLILSLFVDDTVPLWLRIVASCVPAGLVYAAATRKLQRRRSLLAKEFPKEWEAVLERDVVFYNVLDADEKLRFRRLVQIFIGEKPITGIKVEVDATTRVLTAASAVIPIFGFPGWEWHEIREVLIYPARFEKEFTFGDDPDHSTLGMVGSGAMNGIMILSKPDLIDGFKNPGDMRNVGLHEFAHLVDKATGSIDGIPIAGVAPQAVGPWIALVRRKMQEIAAGKSDINPYALTNEAEFFAVVVEYFFERPGLMKTKHPALYLALEKIFNQSMSSKIQAMGQQIAGGKPTFGRNSPCPCGSGIKFKKCCGR